MCFTPPLCPLRGFALVRRGTGCSSRGGAIANLRNPPPPVTHCEPSQPSPLPCPTETVYYVLGGPQVPAHAAAERDLRQTTPQAGLRPGQGRQDLSPPILMRPLKGLTKDKKRQEQLSLWLKQKEGPQDDPHGSVSSGAPQPGAEPEAVSSSGHRSSSVAAPFRPPGTTSPPLHPFPAPFTPESALTARLNPFNVLGSQDLKGPQTPSCPGAVWILFPPPPPRPGLRCWVRTIARVRNGYRGGGAIASLRNGTGVGCRVPLRTLAMGTSSVPIASLRNGTGGWTTRPSVQAPKGRPVRVVGAGGAPPSPERHVLAAPRPHPPAASGQVRGGAAWRAQAWRL